MKHFKDCPHEKYQICTCNLLGEEIALVDWQLQKQEKTLPWYNIIAKLSILGAPNIPLRNK